MKRALTILTSLALIISMFSAIGVNVSAEEATEDTTSSSDSATSSLSSSSSDLPTYNEFLKTYADAAQPDVSIDVDITTYTGADGDHYLQEDYLGVSGTSLYTDETGYVEFTVTVPEDGLYAIQMDYVAENSRGSDIERKLYVNGEMQHAEMQQITFDRVYQNDINDMEYDEETGEYVYRQDTSGNDIRPSQVEIQQWQTTYLRDSTGYILDAMLVYMTAGENTIRLEATSEPLTIANLKVCSAPTYQTYEEVAAAYEDAGYSAAYQDNIIIQGESAVYKSDPVLYPKNDRTTSSTVPYAAHSDLLNSIGGSTWSGSGQSITWEFEVPADGLYTIYIKERQNTSRGVTSSRAIKIDGEIPFSELEYYAFEYNNAWRLEALGYEDEETGEQVAYEFYLTAGTHTITMEVSLGAMASYISRVEDILTELNSVYTTILKVTGSDPDSMTDYQLDDIADTKAAIDSLGPLMDELIEIRDWFIEYSGKGQNDATLTTVINQLNKMYNHYNDVPAQLSYFKTNIGNLGTWLTDVSAQPLEVDYIAVCSDERLIDDLPKANANFFEQFGFEVNNFFDSFFTDYSSVGSSTETTDDQTELTVWVPTGRDQAQIIRKMIDAEFSPDNPNISVTVELVQQSALLPATVAGIGPDVAIQQADTEPVNFALRNAVVDLTQFDDYEEVASRFLEERMVPVTYNGAVYALPETQTFNVLFYRSDILADYGLEVPNTWDEIVAMIPQLLKNNMNFALPVSTTAAPQPGVDIYYAMLFQNGGEVYYNEGESSALDSDTALSAFKYWTNMYINYELSRDYDFKTRFRTGEYPIAVADYTTYNTLVVSAPEINGLWSIALMPGTIQEDGTLDRSTPISGVDCIILSASESQEEAWEFVKWWTSADAQYDYGVELESIMGSSARYATANLEAFEKIPWSNSMYEILSEQMYYCKGVQQVPGSYYMARSVNNAFRAVVINDKDAKESLYDYVYEINTELTNKREEFGIE